MAILIRIFIITSLLYQACNSPGTQSMYNMNLSRAAEGDQLCSLATCKGCKTSTKPIKTWEKLVMLQTMNRAQSGAEAALAEQEWAQEIYWR